MGDEPRNPRPKVFDGPAEERSPKPNKFSNQNYGKYKRSKKHEDRIASALGGKRLPRSGGLSWSKWEKSKTSGGDVKTPDFLIEHKRTETASMSLKREWLEKLSEGARSSMRDPMLVVTFEDPGATSVPEDWVMIPMDVFKRLKG